MLAFLSLVRISRDREGLEKKFINKFFFSAEADNSYEKSLQAKTFPVQIRRI